MPIDIQQIRAQFPILEQQIRNKPLIYFDNAATTQKPLRVIEALDTYYREYNSNIHRGAHFLADKATNVFEKVRTKAQTFLNAQHEHEIIFTYGTTDGLNLLSFTLGESLKEGDEIIISNLEHHSNIVPWQILAARKNAVLKVIPINDAGELDLDVFTSLLSEKTKIVSVGHVSNALGTINPIKQIITKAHEVGAKVIIDGAQGVSHIKVDVQELDVDFYVFSGHKLYGPTGVGILYGKESLLNALPPYRGGGEMIKEVSFEGTTFNELPFKFEAGTPNIADVIAFGEALDFVTETGLANIAAHEHDLLVYATEKMRELDRIEFYGTAKEKVGVISFLIKNAHPFDVGMMLDARGIAVRTGHHCTQPLMKRFNIEGTVRASFAVYNTKSEIDQFIEGLKKTITLV